MLEELDRIDRDAELLLHYPGHHDRLDGVEAIGIEGLIGRHAVRGESTEPM
ncbi:MAG: hypothetical protein HWD60_00445 [Defluviicoccus sp.]|nr:MAG: hypothetical protein HWD60_00445 [Defluviicoccus sp.]